MSYQSKPLYFQSPVFETQSIKQSVDSFLSSKWLPLHKPSERAQLYHYTTLAGLTGILTERSLWLGHTNGFSDPKEMLYGSELIDSIIRDRSTKEKDQSVREFLQALAGWTTSFAKQGIHHTFVGCFCESGNLLSQWRAYAHRGQGYCLGFEFSDKTRVSSQLDALGKGNELFLRRVIYDLDEQKNLVTSFIEAMCTAVPSGLKTVNDPSLNKSTHVTIMAIQASNILMDMVICLKNPAFESEKEWRLVRVIREDIEPSGLKFREVAGELVAYRPTYIYELDASGNASFPVRSLGFGPMLEPNRARPTMQLLVQSLSAQNHLIKLNPNISIQGSGYALRPG